MFYNVESGPTGARSNSLYGYEIATGETKLLVEDTFFIGGDLSPVGDTLYWYDTDYDPDLWTAESDRPGERGRLR